jgi:serine/threonine-protein kinase
MNEGRVINGRFRLVSKLGQGGMGTVWRAVHLELGTPVAVKLIDADITDSRLALSRFKREAQAAASLRSANVVQILDYGIDGEVPFIAMELLEGESLASRLARAAPLNPRVTAKILSQVGKALTRAHALNIVHRDLKPDNVFLVPDGDDEIAKVLDFGIAKNISDHSLSASIQTKSGAILGTPHYMSPEQASGRSSVDHRSDIWSFGIIAFECLTGCRPFRGNTLGGLVIAICTEPIPRPSDLAPVPRGFNDWFARCVCRDQNERFQSMAEAVRTLCATCDPPPLAMTAVPMSEPIRERTLSNSSANSPAFHGALASSVDHPESVSGASRTVGHAKRRRSLTGIVALGVVLLAGGIAAAVGVIRSGQLSGAADAATGTQSVTPTVVPEAAPSVAVVAVVPALSVSVSVSAAPTLSPSPVPVLPAPKARQGGNTARVVSSHTKSEVAAEPEAQAPATHQNETDSPEKGAEPPPDDGDVRRRNIERLGF